MFDFYKSQVEPNSPVTMMMPTTASEAYTVGEALKLSSAGALTKASGTDVPEFISCAKYTAPATGNKEIQVVKVNPDQLYKTTLAAAGTSLKVGNKVTIHTDGEQVTATTTSGVAEIVKMYGTASGSEVLVHF